MARPTKLTPEVQTAIIKAIGLGAPYRVAAHAAGISYEAFNIWMNRGREAKSGEFFQFFHAVEKEKAEAILRHLSVVNTAAAKGEWKASERWLKAMLREEWGDSVDVTSGGKPLEIGINQIDYRAGLTETEE